MEELNEKNNSLKEDINRVIQEKEKVYKDLNNTISSSKGDKKKKKEKPSEIQVDSQNDKKETKRKYKNTESTKSLK